MPAAADRLERWIAMIQRAEPDNSRSERIADPLDRDDPRVVAAREAEAAAYEFYGLDGTDHDVHVPALDCRIRVVEVGSGPPVVAIPGGVGYGVIDTTARKPTTSVVGGARTL